MDEASSSVKAFNRNDEQFLEAFAIFCGLGIQNTQMYETVERAMAKQEITLEVSFVQNSYNYTLHKIVTKNATSQCFISASILCSKPKLVCV